MDKETTVECEYCGYFDLIRALKKSKPAKALLFDSQLKLIERTDASIGCMEAAAYYVGILIPTVVSKDEVLHKVEGIGIYVCEYHLQETIKLIAILYHTKHQIGLTQAYRALEIHKILQ